MENTNPVEEHQMPQIPALRFRLKCMTGENVQVGSFQLENINMDNLVFLRVPEGKTKEELVIVSDNRVGLDKYNTGKQVIIYLDHTVEVLELEPIFDAIPTP